VSCNFYFYYFVILYLQLSIIEYLDETRGPPYLLPRDDPIKRQKVRQAPWLQRLQVSILVFLDVIAFLRSLPQIVEQLTRAWNRFCLW